MPATYDQFILFGDSITQMASSQELGWAFAPALEDAYMRRLDIINRGIGGYNTTKALKVLPYVIPPADEVKLRFLMIFFGANDACLPESDTKQHVPLDQYVQQLKAMVSYPSVQAQAPRIILITPPPICEYAQEGVDYEKGHPLRRRAEVTKAYADAARQLGADTGTPVVDLWNLCMARTGWQAGEPMPGSKSAPRNKVLGELLFDGLHLAPPGYRILYDGLMALIAKEWPDQEPSRLPAVLPNWNDAAAWARWEG